MARRTRRELDIADHLWDCLTRIRRRLWHGPTCCGQPAIYEFARRFNFLTPMAKEVRCRRSDSGPDAHRRARHVPGSERRGPPPAPAMAPRQQKPGPPPPATKSPSKKILYVVNSAGDMHKIEKDTFIIGRSRTCDLVIPSSKVSRQHSGICRENGEYFIEDLGSANGVWREGVKVQKEKIKDGDES